MNTDITTIRYSAVIFYPSADTIAVDEEKPSAKVDNTEYGLAVNGIFSGWDIAFYYADVYNDEAHLELFPSTGPAAMPGCICWEAAVNVAERQLVV